MSIEPVGLLTLFVGIVCLWLGYRAVATAFILASLLGAAAAVFVSGTNIQPAHLFLAFFALASLLHRPSASGAVDAVAPFRAGFWLACLVVYGALTAFAFPRLFAGATAIIPLGVSAYGENTSTVPLGPVSSNVTQTIYMVANLLCFVFVSAIASRREGFTAISVALLAFAAANICFAALDLVTYASGTQGLMDFMRNARYTMHHQEEVNGLKRIVGSFTETSSFAHATLGAFAFTGTLWLCGRRPLLTGALAFISLLLLILSTSSTGLAGVPIVLALLYATALWLSIAQARRTSAIVALTAPLIGAVAVLLVLANQEAMAAVSHYVDVVVLDKFNTESGTERLSWNTVALQNFLDTWGLGAGLGTVRTSSLFYALLANIGVIGLALYLLFIGAVLLAPFASKQPTTAYSADIRMAARNACLGLIIADLLVASTIDQGLIFYVFAAVAVSWPADEVRNYIQRAANAEGTG